MSTTPECAYCGRVAPFTKEHIWPNCIIRRVPTYDARYTERAQKVISGTPTVGDVCSACNNGPLSHLDAYIARLYDTYFAEFAEYGVVIDFRFDYDLLLRWLLKLSYNSARVCGRDIDALAAFAPYLLGDGPRPVNVGVQLQLVGPSYMAKDAPRSSILVPTRVLPKFLRCAAIDLPGRKYDWVAPRLVALNSYYFYLLILRRPVAEVSLHELIDVDESLPGELIEPGQESILLTACGADAASIILPHMISKREAYEKHLRGRKRDE